MKRRIHRYALVAIVSALLGLVLNTAVGVLLVAAPAFGTALAVDGIGFTGMLAIAALGPGIDAMVKYRWPGPTATDRANKPETRDLVVASVAVGLGLVNVGIAVCWVGMIGT